MLALRRASSRASSLLGRGRTFAAIGDKAPDVALDVSFPGPKVCFMMHNLQSTSQQLAGRELRAALQGPPRHPPRTAGRLHAHLIHEEYPGLPRGNRGARGEEHRRSHHLGRQRRRRRERCEISNQRSRALTELPRRSWAPGRRRRTYRIMTSAFQKSTWRARKAR